MKRRFFAEVMTEQELRAYMDRAAKELAAFFQREPLLPVERQYMFLSKFVFSMLIDADRTSTRLFAEQEPPEPPYDYQKLWRTFSDGCRSD